MNLVVHYCTVRKKYATLPYLQPSCITYARCTILKWMSLSDDDDSDREDDEEEEEEEEDSSNTKNVGSLEDQDFEPIYD